MVYNHFDPMLRPVFRIEDYHIVLQFSAWFEEKREDGYDHKGYYSTNIYLYRLNTETDCWELNLSDDKFLQTKTKEQQNNDIQLLLNLENEMKELESKIRAVRSRVDYFITKEA